jgi:hypothetical protein
MAEPDETVQSFREAERSLPRMALKSMNRMIGSK